MTNAVLRLVMLDQMFEIALINITTYVKASAASEVFEIAT